ncbi:MAG: DeoR/GlpR transcriptional regulator [Clostridia bacterium]|nr:DeoR/GlpR transcriptional regulator [Clostridia bacterium]
MLAEERFSRIKERLDERGSVTVAELMEYLSASESTIRRDLNTLDAMGEIIKVHGGALSNKTSFRLRDDEINERRVINMEQKRLIAEYAAKLIRKDDFVYIDAGTTTEYMPEYLTEKNAVYVTNAVTHAQRLASCGCKVYLIGGRLKPSTEAVVGADATEALSRYNFTIGFWGTNGIHKKVGFTTPDREEADVKQVSVRNCKKPYILADSTKFGAISPVKFADFDDAAVITEAMPKGYENCKNIIVAERRDAK